MTWRNCNTSVVMVDEINRRWPGRDRASDGTIGDAAHATRASDHNPWVVVAGVGVVRARDCDKDGVDAAWLVEHIRTLGARRDPRLYPGGYVIFNRRITTPDFTGWKTYTGSNPHDKHFHVSFSTAPAGFDSTAGWGIWPATTTDGGFLMALTDAEQREILEGIRKLKPGQALPGRGAAVKDIFDDHFGWSMTSAGRAADALVEIRALAARLSGPVAGPAALSDADVQRVAAAVVKLLGQKASS